MDVTAVVVVAGRTEPVDALTEVSGVPMVALAVRALLSTGLVDRVRLHDLGARPEALERACAGLPVSVGQAVHPPVVVETHTRQRAPQAVGHAVPFRAEPGGVVLLHDAARPLAPAALGVAVVEAVRSGHGASVPVLPLSDTVKSVDAGGVVLSTPDRSGLRVVQSPVAVRAELLDGDLAELTDPGTYVRRRLAEGGEVHTVPGDPAAFAVRSAWDLELAELLAERTIAE